VGPPDATGLTVPRTTKMYRLLQRNVSICVWESEKKSRLFGFDRIPSKSDGLFLALKLVKNVT